MNILPIITGNKFIVTPERKTSAFPSSTTGFVCHMQGDLFANLVVMAVTIIRRGKAGKNRMEIYEIITPMVSLPEIKDIKAISEGIPTREDVIEIKYEKTSKNLLEWPLIEFIGWMCSHGTFIEYLLSTTSLKLSLPDEKSHPIYTVLRCSRRWNSKGPDSVIDKCKTDEDKLEIIRHIRWYEALLSKSIMLYYIKSTDRTVHIISTLIKTLDTIKRSIKLSKHDLETLNKTLVSIELSNIRHCEAATLLRRELSKNHKIINKQVMEE